MIQGEQRMRYLDHKQDYTQCGTQTSTLQQNKNATQKCANDVVVCTDLFMRAVFKLAYLAAAIVTFVIFLRQPKAPTGHLDMGAVSHLFSFSTIQEAGYCRLPRLQSVVWRGQFRPLPAVLQARRDHLLQPDLMDSTHLSLDRSIQNQCCHPILPQATQQYHLDLAELPCEELRGHWNSLNS